MQQMTGISPSIFPRIVLSLFREIVIISIKYKSIFRIFFNVILAMYPILVFFLLVIQKFPIRIFSLFIIALAFLEFFIRISKRKSDKKKISDLWNSLLLLIIGVICFITNTNIAFKLSPIFMNIIFLFTFGTTLIKPPTMIYRFAVLADKTIPKSLGEKKIAAYCYKVTVLWVLFFLINGCIAVLTVLSGSDLIWVIYNGGIAYVLGGILFVGEFIVRYFVHKKIPKAVPLSSFSKKSRNLSDVMCYEGTWSKGVYKTWGDFIKETYILRKEIESAGGDRWLLYSEDSWHFLLAFTALLQCKKEIILSDNASPACIKEIKEDSNFLTDHTFAVDGIYEKTFHIPSILSRNVHKGIYKCPKIISDETSIVLVASDSSGTRKTIKQQLPEFEKDNSFIISKWGDELLVRKFCSTVNQHNIYGLLFSILLPFTVGIPFRRKMIQAPEELIELIDNKYTIITVPTFLEKAAEILSQNDLLKKSSISFISWKQPDKSIEWTHFDKMQISQIDEGRLIIESLQ